MKCPKCGYTSFDYLRECKKCGEILDDSRKALNLKMSEPTLFVGLDDKPKDVEASEVDKTEEIVESPPETTILSSPEADFSSSSLLDPLPGSQTLPTPGDQYAADLPEDNSAEIGSLGSMDSMHSRGKVDLKDTSDIELELPDKIETGGLEINDLDAPLKGLELNDMAPPLEVENKEDEFALFADDDKVVTENQLENDIPFEFSADDLESDINLSLPSDSPDKDTVELELDMEDEESLDQILAGLETNDSSTK
ncbi:MAG: hypothetical protein U9N63_12085 [Pseudomonadota bacterium]|nr:hypothetical protein [Pseudomonadota bacterium]